MESQRRKTHTLVYVYTYKNKKRENVRFVTRRETKITKQVKNDYKGLRVRYRNIFLISREKCKPILHYRINIIVTVNEREILFT